MKKIETNNKDLLEALKKSSENLKKQERRIENIFGKTRTSKVSAGTLLIYLMYLKQHLESPCQVTGIEDMGCFSWEEYYRFVPGKEKEYDKRKKKQPSYTDIYELLNFKDEYDEYQGIYVNVKRLSDKKRFTLPLADLKGTEKESNNYQFLDDFAVWFANYR
jgi:hypothetical protein